MQPEPDISKLEKDRQRLGQALDELHAELSSSEQSVQEVWEMVRLRHGSPASASH
jgi:prefoldin subunit 5